MLWVLLSDRGIDYTVDAFLGATADGDLEVVRLFVESGLSVHSSDNILTVLQAASVVALAEGHTEVADYLAAAEVEITRTQEAALAALDSLGISFEGWAFVEAVLDLDEDRLRLDIVVLFLEAGLSVNTGNGSLLMGAAEYGSLELVKLLVGLGGSVTAANTNGYTALIAAAYRGHFEMVKFLVEAGADVNIQDYLGRTPLIQAVQSGKLEVVQYLVEQGASVNAKDDDGWTALHWSAESGFLEIVKYLVSQGASLTATDDYGRTARDVAHARTHVVEYFDSLDE